MCQGGKRSCSFRLARCAVVSASLLTSHFEGDTEAPHATALGGIKGTARLWHFLRQKSGAVRSRKEDGARPSRLTAKDDFRIKC